VRNGNVNRVGATLIEKPRSIPEIVASTGISYSTVYRALQELGAERIEDTYPFEWKLPGADAVKSVTSTLAKVGPDHDERVAVGIKHVDSMVSKWNAKRVEIAKEIASMSIDMTDNPADLARSFGVLAGTFANISKVLDDVSGKPDWFELAGGSLDE